MNKTTSSALKDFMNHNQDLERIEAIFPTINGIYRGKWVPAKDYAKLIDGSLRLPVSTYALDSWGIDVAASGLGIINGDPDGIGMAVPHTISRIPWSKVPAAQIIMTMIYRDEATTPCPYDPRQKLAFMAQKFADRGLSAVIATELEFYLIKPVNEDNPFPQPFHPIATGNLNDLDQMQEFEPILNEIRSACEIQDVAADVMIGEAGMCQFEINFKHIDDVLRAGDQAMLFKRIVKGCAKMHGMQATFMAKPFGEDLGSGLHVHVSVLDKNGNNIFDNQASSQNNPSIPHDNLLHATGGLLSTMRQMQAIFAPNQNSFRRLHSGSFAPNKANWGLDHRAASVRLPEIYGPAARLEHRICGADANPYLTISAILAGVLHGIDNKLDPGKSIDKVPQCDQIYLHKDWNQSVDDFNSSQFAKDSFGAEFHEVYSSLRLHEIEQMAKLVTDVELDLYLQGA